MNDMETKNYKVITLCGSTRFKDAFMEKQKELTLQGNIVISVGCFGHAGDIITDEQKEMLDDMHKRKIDMADEIYVINKGDYIGKSTKSEIDYAKKKGMTINYLEPSAYLLIGERINLKRTGEERTVTDVIFFETDTFNQGKYAVTTDDGLYLYPDEFSKSN